MKTEEYINLARRTINEDLSFDDRIVMFTLGLVGEVGELRNELNHPIVRDNVEKELGDIFWYLYNFMFELVDESTSALYLSDKEYINVGKNLIISINRRLFISNSIGTANICENIIRTVGSISEIIKKYRFHNHFLPREKLFKALDSIDFDLRIILMKLNIDRSDVLSKNIEKLKKRYPEGFDSEKSINRVEDK